MKSSWRMLELLAAVVTAGASVSNLNVTSIVERINSSGDFVGYNVTRGVLYPIFLTYVVVYSLRIVANLVLAFKNGGSEQRKQLKIIIAGFLVAFSNSVIFSILLPVATGDSGYSDMSILSAVIFITSVTYSITKHKLLNFKQALSTYVAYILAITTALVIYASSAILVQNTLITGVGDDAKFVVNVFLTMVLVQLYPRLKGVFDKLTNQFFFRDSYDAQEVIDKLNQILVSNVDLEILLQKVAGIVNLYLKTSYCMFYIRPTSYIDERVVGDGREKNGFRQLNIVHDLTAKTKSKVFMSNDEAEDKGEKDLYEAMQHNDIEVLARLVNSVELDVKGVGFMFLGAKRSGSLFSKQDLKIIEIIANELVIAVENVLRYEEIDKFNVTLQQKIDDATRELRRTNEKLVALDEAKDEFVSMASHQLRTPLTSIKGYVSMVAEEDMGKLNAQQKKMLGQALFSSQRMVYLIADLLNVSRLKTGKFVIESKPLHLPTIINSELGQLREGASAKDITLDFECPKEFPILFLDEMKIRQVIMNFTDNAIYYTPSGGKITLKLTEKPKSIEFTVKDTGIGVPKSERHKLFTKFFRADNAKKARPDGTGLGLFMAKKVIIAQGGSVVFNSVEGKGSTFGFNFPKNAVKVPDGVEVDKKKVMTSVGSEAMPEPSLED